MSSYAPFKPPGASSKPLSNPLARALAESEQSLGRGGDQAQQADNRLFSDALSKTGGAFDFDKLGNQPDQVGGENQWDWAKQQENFQKEQERKAAHKKLHDKINPVEMVDVYSARENQVKREIEKLRDELKLLAKDIANFQKQVEVTLMTEVPNPGQEGKYYITFFQKLRAFIMLLRQKIKSASTWATQMHGKKKKKASKFGTGMVIGGQDYEKTSTVQDMMHHERNTAYSGG